MGNPCAQCKYDNDPEARICNLCGADISPDAPERDEAYERDMAEIRARKEQFRANFEEREKHMRFAAPLKGAATFFVVLFFMSWLDTGSLHWILLLSVLFGVPVGYLTHHYHGGVGFGAGIGMAAVWLVTMVIGVYGGVGLAQLPALGLICISYAIFLGGIPGAIIGLDVSNSRL